MSRDLTLFQFDVDEAAVRRLLSSVPGVTPAPPADSDASENGAGHPGDDAQAGVVDADADTTVEDDRGVTGGKPDDDVGSEANRTGSMADADGRSTVPGGTGPSTPWPGAPMNEGGSDSGLLDRLRGRAGILAAGSLLGLGVLSVAAVWLARKRGDEKSGAGGSGNPLSRLRSNDGDATGSEPKSGESGDDSSAGGSRSYPVDVAPVVGIAFLSAATLVLRRLRSSTEA